MMLLLAYGFLCLILPWAHWQWNIVALVVVLDIAYTLVSGRFGN